MLKAKVSFHGHSTFTDGIDNVPKLVKQAYFSGIDYFGVSDHDTTKPIRLLYDEVEKINQTGDFKIIPISASEVRIWENGLETDTIFAKVGDYDSEFISWLDDLIKHRKSVRLVDSIVEAVKKFDCIVVIPHPEMKGASSISFERLRLLSGDLPKDVKLNVGVEFKNWTSNVIPRNTRREKALLDAVKLNDFAHFGLADYHSASDIANQYSLATVENKTSQALMKAIKERKVEPSEAPLLSPFVYLRLLVTVVQSMIRHKFLTAVGKL